ncbi:hypothetical protein DH09_04310 [Bacillaceae bacterium JMAK1]|nr:hypothetical protein DH09_04310 [Bacillaceae bacterium JMAK1]
MGKEPFVYNPVDKLLHLEPTDQQIVAGFTSRNEGASRTPYNEANLGLHVGDDHDDVISNRERLSAKLGVSLDDFIYCEQVHKNIVQKVTSKERSLGTRSMETVVSGADGLYTRDERVVLATLYADCVPLLFTGDQGAIVGTAHAGWKGTAGNIGGELVRQWIERENVDVSNIHAYVGPSIGKEKYVVDDRVIDQLKAVLPSDVTTWKWVSDGQYELDLKLTNALLIEQAGVPRSHITVSGYCTASEPDLFYSHRRDGSKTGRMAAYIMRSSGS